MASYNHERFVEAMVRSVLAQTVSDIELVVVDDGSRDKTPEILSRLAADDSRIRFLPQQNQGVVAARNRAAREARAEFISVIDSDDLLPPDRTERLLEVLSRDASVVLAWGDAEIIDEAGQQTGLFSREHPPILEGNFSEELFCRYCFVPAVSVMVRRQALEETGYFWGSGPTTDYIKWIELGLVGKSQRIAGAVLGAWRLHKSNASAALGQARAEQYLRLKDDLEQLLHRYPNFARSLPRARIDKRFAHLHFMAGFFYAMAAEWASATLNYQTALSLTPKLKYVAALLSTRIYPRAVSQAIYKMLYSLRSL